MTQEQKTLYKIIDELLWNEWDPIGVNEYEEARDEYYDYIPQVFKLKIDNADNETIAQYLFKVETERMGLFGNIENLQKSCQSDYFNISVTKKSGIQQVVWQYGGATNMFSAFCSLVGFSSSRRITPSNRINNELLFINLAAVTG